MSNQVRLPYSHGMETELQLVDVATGSILRGKRLLEAWDRTFTKATGRLSEIKGEAPEPIRSKIVHVGQATKDRHGKTLRYVVVRYLLGKKEVEVDAFGPDPNVSQITWILELVTPPCETVEELSWWASTLLIVACESVPQGVGVVATGLCGAEEEYQSGVTFGDHHHVGIPKLADRMAAYDLLRNYLPHLIALTVNSPFIGRAPTGKVLVKEGARRRVLPKDCTRSLRMKYNTGQLGPPDKNHFVPHLEKSDRRLFDEKVARSPPDDRYVDLFPFTDYGTIELRFSDTQLSVSRRVAIALVVQALCRRAIAGYSGKVPAVSSEALVNSREKAVEHGLLGKFFDDPTLPPDFAASYSSSPWSGKRVTRLFEAVRAMFEFLHDDLAELGFFPFLKPLLLSVYGSQAVEAPLSPADYQLYLFQEMGGNYDRVFRKLVDLTKMGAVDPCFDPLLDAFGEPVVVEPLIVAREAAAGAVEENVSAIPPPVDLKVKGQVTVATKQTFPGKSPKFSTRFLVQSGVQTTQPGKLLFRLVLSEGDREEVLATVVKSTPLSPGKYQFSEGDASLAYPFGAFSGSGHGFIQVELQGPDGELIWNAKAGNLLLHGTPDVQLQARRLPKVVRPNEEFAVGFSVANRTPNFDGKFKLKILVLSPTNKPLASGEKPLDLIGRRGRSDHAFKFRLGRSDLPVDVDHVKFRAQVLGEGKLVTEAETTAVPTELAAPTGLEPELKGPGRSKARRSKSAVAAGPPRPRVQVRTVLPPTPVKPSGSLKKPAHRSSSQRQATTPPKAKSSRKSGTATRRVSGATKRKATPKPSGARKTPQTRSSTSSTPTSSLSASAPRSPTSCAVDWEPGDSTTFFLEDRVKYSFSVTAGGAGSDISPKCHVRVFFIAGGRKFLLAEQVKTVKGQTRARGSFKYSPALPLTATFTLRCEVVQDGRVVCVANSPPLSFENKRVGKLVRVRSVEVLAPVAYPGRAIPLRVTVQTGALVRPEKLRFRTELFDPASGDALETKTVLGTVPANGTYHLTLVAPCPPRISSRGEMKSLGVSLLVCLSARDPPVVVAKVRKKAIVAPQTPGLEVVSVGPPKEEYAASEDVPVQVHLANRGDEEFRGKLELFLGNPRVVGRRAYDRKFHLLGGDSLVEWPRVNVPTDLKPGRVTCLLRVKAKGRRSGSSVTLVDASTKPFKVVPGNSALFETRLETDRNPPVARPGDVVLLRAVVRSTVGEPVQFAVVARDEKGRVKTVATGKVKGAQMVVRNARWKVPKWRGGVDVAVELAVAGSAVDPRLVAANDLKFLVAPE